MQPSDSSHWLRSYRLMPIQCKPILWTRAKVDELTPGEWICGANLDWYATGVRREPGRVVHGDLFITAGPIGQNLVANNINRLFAQGAVAVVTSVRPSTNTPWGPVLLVPDTNHVYESLAADSLARATAKIIGVTGSVGKTGTKDAIAHALSHQGTVLSTPGSANSDTVIMELLCQLAPNIDYAVAELGMLGPNSMLRKAGLCQPHVALITAIGASHRHHHNSELSIAKTKSDILTGVRPGGVAVLPRDSRFFDYLVDRAKSLGNIADIVTFGRHAESDVRLVNQCLLADGTDVEIVCHGRRLRYRVGLPGEHHAMNSLAVLAVVDAVGADVRAAASTLKNLSPSFRRGERFRIELAGGPCEIIDDTWNASPESVAAALRVLSLRPLPTNGRRVAALGDMLELGPKERQLHRDLAEVITTSRIDIVHTVGMLMQELRDALPGSVRGQHFASSVEMAEDLPRLLLPGDCLLVKGSNATNMARVVTTALRRRTREESAAPRYWSLAAEMGATSADEAMPVDMLEESTCVRFSGTLEATPHAANVFFSELRGSLAIEPATAMSGGVDQQLLAGSGLPASFWGFAITLYQPGVERLMVVRAAQASAFENVCQVMRQLPKHPRFSEFDIADWQRCRMQVDFIVEEPEPVELAT
ncbi:MAG: Mur ligase family protein, partial [Candidatus Paceibacterota bacterium]